MVHVWCILVPSSIRDELFGIIQSFGWLRMYISWHLSPMRYDYFISHIFPPVAYTPKLWFDIKNLKYFSETFLALEKVCHYLCRKLWGIIFISISVIWSGQYATQHFKFSRPMCRSLLNNVYQVGVFHLLIFSSIHNEAALAGSHKAQV